LARDKESTHLQRLFSSFPDQWAGIGLLLLRMAIGLIAVIQGGLYLLNRAGETFEAVAVGVAIAASGISLLIGFLTPLAGALIAVATMGIALSWLPPPTPNLFDAPVPLVLVVTVCAAVAFLGPGAFSVDSRLFGRRRIIIPDVRR
jgi:putative oxidoreductase